MNKSYNYKDVRETILAIIALPTLIFIMLMTNTILGLVMPITGIIFVAKNLFTKNSLVMTNTQIIIDELPFLEFRHFRKNIQMKEIKEVIFDADENIVLVASEQITIYKRKLSESDYVDIKESLQLLLKT